LVWLCLNVVRKGLKEDMPEVYSLLDNFHWTLAEIGQQMGWNAEGAEPYDSAKKWIKENPARVNEWMGL
jgi:glycine betaine/proline transport system substrate-binding protein